MIQKESLWREKFNPNSAIFSCVALRWGLGMGNVKENMKQIKVEFEKVFERGKVKVES